jgi:hypothetical protein
VDEEHINYDMGIGIPYIQHTPQMLFILIRLKLSLWIFFFLLSINFVDICSVEPVGEALTFKDELQTGDWLYDFRGILDDCDTVICYLLCHQGMTNVSVTIAVGA